MNKLFNMQITTVANILSKEKSLYDIMALLQKNKVQLIGNPTNTSKKKLLIKSLKAAEENKVKKIIDEVRKRPYSFANHKVDNNILKLHPTFKGTKVEKFLKSSDFEEAVRVAFLRINNRVKLLTGQSLDGASLMRTAFSRNNPILKVTPLQTQEEKDEQEGIMHIFEGAMLAFRNPQSHNDEKRISPKEAYNLLTLANYLMGILDKFN